MKARFLAMLAAPSLLVAFTSHAQLSLTDEEAIAYTQSIEVKTLDPSLSSQRLGDWLQSGPPHLKVLKWISDETCDTRPDANIDYPRCVRIEFERGGQAGYFLVLIGTERKGIIGPPRLYEGIGVFEGGFVNTGGAERLSGLPGLLDQPVVTGGVNDFYQRIVERHPIGIPTGADKTALWPSLSRRLTQQLDAAQACQDDYFRQHSNESAGAKPAWLDTGIFVGHGKRALPLSAFATHKEPQKDGSFAVSVSLTYVKLPGFVPDEANWAVIANVVPEDNRFVVDDVRLFDGLDTDGPSHLLSESLAGCDGTHWTGEHIENKPPAALPLPHYTDWDAVNAVRKAAYDEEVAFAKALDVHQLDPLLPSQSLEDWLKYGSLHVSHIQWDGLKCNIKEGGYRKERQYLVTHEPDGRLCASVWFQRGNALTRINVSTFVKGKSVPPEVTYIGVADKDDRLLTPVPADDNMEEAPDSLLLSDLPRLLDEEAVINVTRNLYDAVVAHHPLGIPHGQNMAMISPLVSQRLRQQLQTAQACRADYLRQYPRPGAMPKPAWLNAGPFSGDGALALPGADFVDHKARQEDGSFQVLVWLSHKNSAAPESAPPASRWRIWHVSALVKSEDGRFVVDDVRLFGDDSIDGPSRLLSDSLTGCDGPRWVGIGSTTR
ncbi:MAG TPA: hypothetical protein VK819_12805 [Acidobacteriaceae bacterium]|nr:hypothetical protein [Acidobacteriaceae bacterium]